MKNFLVFALIITLIFPAYCFSYQKETINEESDKLLISVELLDEIIYILEDDHVEMEESEYIMELIESEFETDYCKELLVKITYYTFLTIVAIITKDSASTIISPLTQLINYLIDYFQNCVE